MTEMFNHLNQQLRQLHKVPNVYGYPQTQQPRQFLNPLSPNAPLDYSDGLQDSPRGEASKARPSLPPYMDPNSI
jgi:hypothetical protein